MSSIEAILQRSHHSRASVDVMFTGYPNHRGLTENRHVELQIGTGLTVRIRYKSHVDDPNKIVILSGALIVSNDLDSDAYRNAINQAARLLDVDPIEFTRLAYQGDAGGKTTTLKNFDTVIVMAMWRNLVVRYRG